MEQASGPAAGAPPRRTHPPHVCPPRAPVRAPTPQRAVGPRLPEPCARALPPLRLPLLLREGFTGNDSPRSSSPSVEAVHKGEKLPETKGESPALLFSPLFLSFPAFCRPARVPLCCLDRGGAQ